MYGTVLLLWYFVWSVSTTQKPHHTERGHQAPRRKGTATQPARQIARHRQVQGHYYYDRHRLCLIRQTAQTTDHLAHLSDFYTKIPSSIGHRGLTDLLTDPLLRPFSCIKTEIRNSLASRNGNIHPLLRQVRHRGCIGLHVVRFSCPSVAASFALFV